MQLLRGQTLRLLQCELVALRAVLNDRLQHGLLALRRVLEVQRAVVLLEQLNLG